MLCDVVVIFVALRIRRERVQGKDKSKWREANRCRQQTRIHLGVMEPPSPRPSLFQHLKSFTSSLHTILHTEVSCCLVAAPHVQGYHHKTLVNKVSMANEQNLQSTPGNMVRHASNNKPMIHANFLQKNLFKSAPNVVVACKHTAANDGEVLLKNESTNSCYHCIYARLIPPPPGGQESVSAPSTPHSTAHKSYMQ